jgi:NitT/TauT family transport system substrate-binding protein
MRRTLSVGLVLIAAVLIGCGGGEGEGSSGSSAAGAPATVKVGVLPIVDVAPLYVGRKQGFFEQEGLTVQPQVMQGGAAVTAAAVSGSIDLGFAATEPLIIAKSKGLPVQIITQGVQASPQTKDASDAVLVASDSKIRRPADLAGTTIATNALQNMNELSLRAVLERDGVDTSKIRFLEGPCPEMTAALKAGRVDAITAVEPFVTQAKAAGARPLMSFFAGLEPKLTIATYFATTKYIDGHADVVKRFARAMNRSLTYSQEHPEAVRAALPTYTKIPAKVAGKMGLPFWSSDLNRPSIQLVADEAKKIGFVDSKPDLKELIWSGAS